MRTYSQRATLKGLRNILTTSEPWLCDIVEKTISEKQAHDSRLLGGLPFIRPT